MPKIRHINGDVFDVAELPVFVAGIWECGNVRFTDPDGTLYEVVEETAYGKISPIEFKLRFTSTERVAIKKSADEHVKDFFELVENQREVNAADPNRGLIDLDLKATQDALVHIASQQLIAADRVEQILKGQVQ